MLKSDRPISQQLDDLLGRVPLAEQVYALATQKDLNSAISIGVYGGWGEGKTSILKLVEGMARHDKVAFCWFSVWSAETQTDLWLSLLRSLQAALHEPDRILAIKKGFTHLTTFMERAAPIDAKANAAHAFVNVLAPFLKAGPKDAQRLLTKLDDHRIIIAVDDIDRAMPALLATLLMGLHEIFSEMPNASVILALDPSVVSASLGTANPSWNGTSTFLEKIVQFPIYLPQLVPSQAASLALAAMRDTALPIDSEVLADFGPVLPRTPRRIKQFARGLQRLSPVLRRLGEEEWNPHLLVLTELVREACPPAAETLFADDRFVHEFLAGPSIADMKKEHVRISDDQRARVASAVGKFVSSGEEALTIASNICRICEGSSTQLTGVGAEAFHEQLQFDGNPPSVTLKEFDAMVQAASGVCNGALVRSAASTHAVAVRRSELEVLGGVLSAAGRRRSQLADEAQWVASSDEHSTLLQRAQVVAGWIDAIIDDVGVFADRSLPARVERFVQLKNQAAHLTNLLTGHDPLAEAQRAREQVRRATHDIHDVALEVLTEFKSDHPSGMTFGINGENEINQMKRETADELGAEVCKGLFGRFQRKGGMAAIGNYFTNRVEIELLNDTDSVFHSSAERQKLQAMAESADDTVSENFFSYLRMLLGPLRNSPPTAAPADLAALLRVVWLGTSRMRPQPRTAAQVAEMAKRLQALLPDDKIELPTWAAPTGAAIIG